MKELYTQAATIKCRKPKALELLKDMYQKMNDAEKEKYLDTIANLMSFFTPKPTGKVKKPMDWVNLAISKEQSRYYLCYAYSDGEWLVATDGHRLHRIKTSLSKGYHDTAGNAIDIDGTFPDYKKLFFDIKDKIEVTLDVDNANTEHYNKKWFYVFEVEGVEWAVNKKYLDEALNGNKILKGHFDVDVNLQKQVQESQDQFEARKKTNIVRSVFQSEDKTILLTPFKLR